MRDSARSNKQNIVEGWKRSTTKEYYDFLSFSLGSLGELKEDGEDSFKDNLVNKSNYDILMDKCREEDYLLNRLKQALYRKMETSGELPIKEKYQKVRISTQDAEAKFDKYLEDTGLTRLEDGRYTELFINFFRK